MQNNLEPLASDKILCVKVGKIKRENLYEMARKYWKLKLERASQATHVLAIVNGEVAAVYIPSRWYYTENSVYLGRIEFEGIEDVHSEYIGKSVRHIFGRSANPTLYINM